MKNFLALFLARNREFYRDKGSLAWSIFFPLVTDRKFNRMRPSMARVLGLETRSAKEG